MFYVSSGSVEPCLCGCATSGGMIQIICYRLAPLLQRGSQRATSRVRYLHKHHMCDAVVLQLHLGWRYVVGQVHGMFGRSVDVTMSMSTQVFQVCEVGF